MVKNHHLLLGFCICFIFIKLIAIYNTNFNLYGDEAQYWLWSKNIAFGYFSKPPLLPWLIRFVCSLAGNSFFVLKLIPIILYCITSYFVFILSKKLWGDRLLAIYCALTFFLLPSVSFSSFLLSTDILLILFWTLGLIQLLNIKDNPSKLNFIYLGIILGCAFLSKYAAIYFIISLIIFLIVEKNFRIIFFKSKFNPFFFILAILLIVLPNILWNYQNSWVTLEHTAENASLNNIKLNYIGLLNFLLSQLIMVGPILFIGFLYCFLKNSKITSSEKFLLSFGLPALLIVLIESFLVRAHANWAAVSLVSLSILFIEKIYKYNKKIIDINNYLNLAAGIILFVMIGASLPLVMFDRIKGIKDFVYFLDINNKNNVNNIVVSDRLLFANLSYAYFLEEKNFYTPKKPGARIGNHFHLKNPLPENFSKNFILVGDKNEISYLIKKLEINKIGFSFFPFSKEKLEIYEISFD